MTAHNINGHSSIDFAAINAAAAASYRSILPRLVPGGKVRGPEFVACNPRRNDQHPGSFKINIRSGEWSDFATGDKGGDFVSYAAYVRGVGQGEAARELADWLGIEVPPLNNGGTYARPAAMPRPAVVEAPAPIEAPPVVDAGQIPRCDAPHKFVSGDQLPARFGEIRRHVYRRAGEPVRVKIKIQNRDGSTRFENWYAVTKENGATGWQPKKPAGYVAVPYVSSLDPFDPELRADRLYWPEGEKDVDTLARLGAPAFTFGGTGDGLPAEAASYLSGRHIAILADNDAGGEAHAEKKAALAHAAGAVSVRVVHFPELPPKGDVTDFIERGGTVEELSARVDAVPVWSPAVVEAERSPRGARLVMQRASDIEARPIDWLWPERIAIGKLTMFAGEPGLGKSQIGACLAAAVTTGGHWPNGEGRAALGSVIILSAEDDAADTIIPRLMAAGADLSRVHIISAVTADDGTGRRMFNLQTDLAALERAIAHIGDVRLVEIDPVSSYLGKADSHKNSEVRAVLEPISEMAARHRVAVVAVTHFSKGANTSANNRIIGSIGFVAVARGTFIISRDPEDDKRRLFVPSKTNIGPDDRGGLGFRIETRQVAPGIIAPAVSWDGQPVTRTADEILSAMSGGGDRHTSKADAAAFLEDALSGGPVSVPDLEAMARAAGILGERQRIANNKPLRSAADDLGVVKRREGFGPGGAYRWSLPCAPSDPMRAHARPISEQGAHGAHGGAHDWAEP
jgi:hypothetical protein